MRSLVALLLAGALSAPLAASLPSTPPLPITVTLHPLKHLAEVIGGNALQVAVLLPAGRNPHSFDPSPSQLRQLSGSRILLAAGSPFEKVWVPRIRQQLPKLPIVDIGTPLSTRRFSAGELGAEESGDAHGDHDAHADHDSHDSHSTHGDHDAEEAGMADPHWWTSPALLRQASQAIAAELIRLDPANQVRYRAGLATLLQEIAGAEQRIATLLQPARGRTILLFHPSFGYFADQYGLRQLAIEQAGHQPGPQTLSRILAQARAAGVGAVFVQAQFDQRIAQSVAQQLKVPVVKVDNLSEQLLPALEAAAAEIARSSAGSAGTAAQPGRAPGDTR